jgi:carboxymethylenebutenolidase
VAARQNVTFPSNGGEGHGYLATPPSGSGPGLVVIQEWWGLTDHIASLVDRFASEGFVALAPDLYGGKTTHDPEEAGKLMQALPVERASRDLGGAVDYLLGRDDVQGDQVGAVGFCMGGAFVLSLAAQQGERVGAAVPFYPVGPMPDDCSKVKANVMIQWADNDDFQADDALDQLTAKLKSSTGREPEVNRYPAGHAFLNDENLLGTHDPAQAKAAWDRTVSFLRQNLS